MKFNIHITAIVATLILLSTVTIHAQNYVQGEVLVKIDKQITSQEFVRQFDDIKLTSKKELSDRMNIWLFEFPINFKMDTVINILGKNRSTIHVQPNHYVQQRKTNPHDPGFGSQWGMLQIKAPDAWEIVTGGTTVTSEKIVIAVVDSGFDLTHEDMNYWQNNDEIPGNNIDDDNNGYIDDVDGWNASSSNGNIEIGDHGTHVAGIAGAVGNNGKGVTGVNWNVQTMPIVGSSSTESVVIEALGYALEMRAIYNESDGAQGAFVVVTNGSFGVDKADPQDYPLWCSIYDDLGQEGILSVAATANEGWDVEEKGDIPTTCTSDFLITVTNTDQNDDLADDAAWGQNSIDLAAPGTDIYSTLTDNGYGNLSGTSMAAPHVSGAVALMYAAACEEMIQDYHNNPAEVALSMKQTLVTTSDPIYDLLLKIGYGRLNIYRSIVQMFDGYNTDLHLTGIETASEQYEAMNTITTENYTVPDNIQTTLKAGQSITLLPNTRLEPGLGRQVRISVDNHAFNCAIEIQPLTIDLLAPEYPYCGGGHSPITCNAIPTGGVTPYSYTWYTKDVTSNNWVTQNSTNPNVAFLSNQDFYLKVEVTDDEGMTAMSPTKFINCVDALITTSDSTDTSKLNIIDLTSSDNLTGSAMHTEQQNLKQTFKVSPNPVSEYATISFSLEIANSVTIQLLDSKGNLIETIIEDKPYDLGQHTFEHNTKHLSAGLYVYAITTNTNSYALRFIITN